MGWYEKASERLTARKASILKECNNLTPPNPGDRYLRYLEVTSEIDRLERWRLSVDSTHEPSSFSPPGALSRGRIYRLP